MQSPNLCDIPTQISSLEQVATSSPVVSALWVKRLCWLAVIIAMNCLALAVAEGLLYWRTFLYGTPPNYFPLSAQNICMRVLTAQFLFIGFWFALASERLVVRMIAGTLLAGLLLGEYLLFVWLLNERALFGFGMEAGNYCGLTVISLLLLRALRPWFGWRVGWEETPPESRKRQFSIVDLMTWTAAVAIPLGLLQSMYGNQGVRIALTALFSFALALPVSIPAFRWAVATDRRRRWLVGFAIWAFVGPFLPVVPVIGWYYLTGRFSRIPSSRIIWGDPLFAFYAPLAVVWIGNVLAMQRIGLRTWKMRTSPETPSSGSV